MTMVKKMHYKNYPKTIKLFTKKDGSDKPKMVPTKKWVARDSECQPIVSYIKNTHHTNDIGFVLENLLVIDIDVGHAEDVDGRVSFSKWVKTHTEEEQAQLKADMLDTMRVETPSGGMHIYFALPLDKETYDGPRVVGAMEGVDLLTGKNSYTPTPNSKRHDGMYKLANKSDGYIREAPQWVVDLFDNAQSKSDVKSGSGSGKLSSFQTNSEGSYLNSSIYKILSAMLDGFEKGTRNDGMTSLVGSLAWQIYNDKITEEIALRVVGIASQNSSPPMSKDEVNTIWNSIMKKEIYKNEEEEDIFLSRKKW